MQFLFHSVFDDGHHVKYFSVYQVSKDRYRAECHHFNRDRNCSGDFELLKTGEGWQTVNHDFDREGEFIAQEIERSTEGANLKD